MSLLTVVVLLVTLTIAHSLPQLRRGKLVHGQEVIINNSSEKIVEKDSPFDYYFTQEVDHFDRANTQVFQQRYFVNTTYWKGPDRDAPVFLCVGGEGPPLDYMVLVSSVHCNDMVELAPKHGALLVALEHRYYGKSVPKNDFSTENLRYLNSEQALEDIAQFHSVITEKFSLTANNKWVTWGGSYPGMMAALSRLRFPNLIHASISSSSPLQAQVNMFEYNDAVADSIATEIVGGSQECLNVVVEGHKTIKNMLASTDGRRNLESMFNVCVPGSLDDEKNQEQFAGDGVIYLPAQSNDPACTTQYCNIEKICVLLTDNTIGTPLDRLVTLAKAQQGSSCNLVSYDAMLKTLSNPKNPERSWLYQTCTEWGFYQTCMEGSGCPYTQGLHTLDVDYDICLNAFSIDAATVAQQIQSTLSRYGGNYIQSSRILFPNGQIDPWYTLGVLTAPNDKEPVLWVEGASHHFWTHPSLPTDSDFVKDARVTIWNQVDQWLEEN